MAEKVAFAKKASAETRLKVAMKDLSEKVDQDNGTAPTEQFLSRSIATLATHWISFENAHNSHVELVDLEATVPLLEAYGRVASKYDEVVEKGEALRASRLPQAPVARLPTLEEQYEVASDMRETTFGEADDAIASVADYFKDKREETPTSLENQRQELRKAEGLLKEARVYTDAMALVMPEHAVRDRAADSAKQREVMKLISKQMKVLSLLSTAAPPVSGVASRDSSYMYSRRPLPSFGGARRDYPSFRREWQSNVTGKFSAEYELREIKQNTPAEVEPDLKNLKSMEAVWEFLDRKYGRTMELASELINGLHNFKFSNNARSESARFAELDREWTKVYYDLEEVGKLDALNHEPTLTGFAHKLPSVDAKKAYGELRIKMGHECRQATPPTEVSELKIMETFMKAERERQEVFAGLLDDEGPDPKPRERTSLRQEGKRENVCYRCGKPGHLKADCPGTGGGRSYATSQQGSYTPCPVCEQSHTFQGRDGRPRPSTRLSACANFRTLGVEERVAVLEKANGCARCLDFTGEHLRSHCPCKGPDGQPFTCNENMNGVRCGKEHHAMLHGSVSKFSCYVRVNRVHISVAPTDETAANKNSTTLMELPMIPGKDGNHAEISTNAVMESQETLEMMEEEEQINMSHMVAANDAGFQVPECQDLGVSQARRCGSCTTCVRCSNTAVALTRREPEELTMIEENVELDVEKHEETFHYPLIKDPKMLVDNCYPAEAIAERLESRLVKQEGIEAYNQDIKAFDLPWKPHQDTIDMQHGVNLSAKERGSRVGPELTLETVDQMTLGHRPSPPWAWLVMVFLVLAHLVQTAGPDQIDTAILKRREVIRYKMLPQSLSAAGRGWDDELDEELAMLEALMELCGWLDEGKPALAACLYARYEKKVAEAGGTHLLSVLMGKARVAPSSKYSERIRKPAPKTEMQGFTMLARMTTACTPGMPNLPKQISLFGDRAKVVSDSGSQVTSAGNSVAWGADGKQDGSKLWAEVESVSARRRTSWDFVPAGAQFRNRLAEARVKAVKQTLGHILMTTLVSGKPTLSYAELLTVLAQVANIVNYRPIWAKVLTVPLTVNQLLLGRTSTSPLCEGKVMGKEGEFRAGSGYVDNLFNTWWSLWKQQGLASLLPYNKLKDERRHKNLQEGDVCLLQCENKVKNTYRLCRIKEVKVSEDGLGRTVTIGYRAKRKGKLLPYVSAPLTTMDVAIQRLVLLVPSEKVKDDEAWMEG